jgi:hypothetical protein
MDTMGVYNAPANKIYIYVDDPETKLSKTSDEDLKTNEDEEQEYELVMIIQKRKMGWFYWCNFEHQFQKLPDSDRTDHTDPKSFMRTGKGNLRRLLKTKLKNCVTRVEGDLNGHNMTIYPPKYK